MLSPACSTLRSLAPNTRPHMLCHRSVDSLLHLHRPATRAGAHNNSGAGSLGGSQGDDAHSQKQPQEQQQQAKSRWQSLKAMVKSQGPGAFFAYITVSNLLSVGTLCSAWVVFTRQSGQTPLQAWPQFLACYAGVYAAQHLARPYKIAAGLAAAPLGTAAVSAAARLLRVSQTTALVVLLVVEAVALLSCLGAVVLYAGRIAAAG